MDVSLVKKENAPETHFVKVEEQVEPEVTTVVVQNFPELSEVRHQIISSKNLPTIVNSYGTETGDGNVQIVQLEDGQYTYIIENSDGLETGTQFELSNGEQYIIEEYQGDYEEGDQNQFETVYIQQQQGMETTEIYTISEEVESPSDEDDDQPDGDDDDDDDDDDHQMAIVEDVEHLPQKHNIIEKKPASAIIQRENLHVQIKQPLKTQPVQQSKNLQKPGIKSEIHKESTRQVIKQETDLVEQGPDQQEIYSSSTIINEKIGNKHLQHADLGSEWKSKKSDIELLYECGICTKTFRTPAGVKRHISLSHSKLEEDQPVSKDELSFSLCPCCGEPSDSAHTAGDFHCDQCGKLFTMKNCLERHKSIEHPAGKFYECYECKKSFATKESIVEHTKVHSLKSVKCDDCGREFSRKYHLYRHIGQTGCMGVPKQVYECRVCSKTFTRKDNLAEHLKAHAGILNKQKKQYMCEFCMKEFSGVALLQIHLRTHTGERPYGCDICEKRFPSSGAMKKHRRKHTGEKPYQCPQCGVKFAAKETLNRHWRTHTGEKPHQCKFCGKSFIQPSQLRAHIFHHTGENAYTCPHCNRAFNRKLRLTTHIKYMHEGAEPLPCPQAGCDKTFFRKEDIQRHMMTHSDERPFKCDVCDKGFSVKSSLKIHKNIHKKEPPVSCEVCTRAFIRKDCLMRHMRARHRDVLEDIVANAEKKRLQAQLFRAVSNEANKEAVKNSIVWNELSLTESIKELLSLLVDEECLVEFGHPDAPVDKVLESVIRRCGHAPALESKFDYIGRMRENAKLLFTVVIDDKAVKELLNNQTVDEVIMLVLKLAKKQASGTLVEHEVVEVEVKPTVFSEDTSEQITLLTEDDTSHSSRRSTEYCAGTGSIDEPNEEGVDDPVSISSEDNSRSMDADEENTVEYVIQDSLPPSEKTRPKLGERSQ